VNLFKKIILAIIISITAIPALAGIEIEITKALDSAQPIAIVPFKIETRGHPLPENIADIIRNDFARSGEFRPLDVNSFNQRPSRAQEIDPNYWRGQGVDNIVVGHVTEIKPGLYKVDVALVDAFMASQAQQAGAVIKPTLDRSFDVPAHKMREFSHFISDLIYQQITGVRGVFSTRIAYVSFDWLPNNRRMYKLEVSDFDGYNPTTILTSKEPIMSPSWSPDGYKVAYVSFERHRSEIYVADLRTGRRDLVSGQPGINGAPAWSPDGTKMALVLSKEDTPKIHILDLATHRMQQVTDGFSIDTEPRWYPDSRALVFTSTRGGQPQLYKLNLGDKRVTRLTFEGNYNARGSITPDGKRLIMIHRSGNDAYGIAVQDLENNQLRILTQTRLDESPSLAPNGRVIMYGTAENGRRVLGGVSLDGRVKWRVPSRGGELREPAWSSFLN
jgi:TolB protein